MRSGNRMKRGLVFGLAAALLIPAHAAFAELPATSNPTLSLNRTIRTTPFTGTSVSMRDNEGSAYVPSDNSLWVADDNGDAIYEVNPTTGALKRTIPQSVFSDAVKLGGGSAAGANRSEDFEAIAYDVNSDHLYVLSGPCCSSTVIPTAFRLTRQSGSFQVESYQALPSGADYTGAAWNPDDDRLYVGKGQQIRSFDYSTGGQGSSFSVGGVSGINGMDFTTDGADLLVTTNGERLIRIRWSTRTVVSGWNFDLTPFGMRDSRAVSLIGEQFFVSDGYDGRSSGDPLRYAVFVFDVEGGTEPPPPSGNLIGNAGFETDTGGWSVRGSGAGVVLERVSSGHSGSWSALVDNRSTGKRKCVLNDDPNWVANTAAGTYTASIWVRADTGGARIRLKLSELSGTSVVRSRSASGTLSTSWQHLSVVLSSVPSGRSLDMQVFVPRDYAPPGRCFYGDDASMTVS